MTIADCEHRLHLIPERIPGVPNNWKPFYDWIKDDVPMTLCIDIINWLKVKYPDALIIYSTARNVINYQATVDWLKKHKLWKDKSKSFFWRENHTHELLLRPNNAREKASVIKQRQLALFITDQFKKWVMLNFICAIDDSLDALKMYQEYFDIKGISSLFFRPYKDKNDKAI